MATASPGAADTEQISSFLESPQCVGMPRRGPYLKLIHRFYEALFLLRALGQTRDQRTSIPRDVNEIQASRRRLLRNLAYICDFDKGGISCTSIGLEATKTNYIFWVASNGKVKENVLQFLRSTIESLKRLCNMTEQERMSQRDCNLRHVLMFSRKRIKKEGQCLRKYVNEAKRSMRPPDYDLVSWLESLIQEEDVFELCTRTFAATRNPEWMKALDLRGLQETARAPFAERLPSFVMVKHYIGRLVAHIRSYTELVEDACKVAYLLDTYAVRPVEWRASVPPPVKDSKTNLHGILGRFFRNEDPEKAQVEEALLRLNQLSQNSLFSTFLHQYDCSAPQVHAEIQMLEHFHRKNLPFVDNDRYVGCSKPSCVCCMLYFKYHPARMVVPECHQKVWANWGPPLIETFRKDDAESICQRDIMNRITQSLRDGAIQEVLNSSTPPRWHPDSVTDIGDNTDALGSETVNIYNDSDSDSDGGVAIADVQ